MEPKQCPAGCPDGELCRQLKKHIHGRLYEIWQGVNIDPALAEKYRQLWRRQAALGDRPKEVRPTQAVPFRPRGRCCGR